MYWALIGVSVANSSLGIWAGHTRSLQRPEGTRVFQFPTRFTLRSKRVKKRGA